MSNSSTQQNERTHLPDPATASAEELLRYLAVDPDTGLGGREADRRRDRAGTQPLFSTTARSFSKCLLAVLREPVLWIMLAITLIALFFNRVGLGLTCFAFTAGHAFLCAWLLRRAERIDGAMQKAYDAPLPRVLRSGRLCRVGAEAVVPGDILIIYAGDLIPADCRLLRTERFSVSERELDAKHADRPARRLDKDADGIPEDTGSPRFSPVNMVFAGAVAESGFAVAVVTAVGSDTHLGALMGTIRPAHGIRRPASAQVTSRVYTVISLTLAVLIIPLVAVGIFRLGDRNDFFDIFLSALAVATLCLCEHTVVKMAYLSAVIRRDAALMRDRINAAEIRSETEAERLCTMTDLLLLGSAALHDGKAHPVELWTGGRRHRCDEPDVDEDAEAVVELLFLWHHGRAALPSSAAGAEQGTDAVLETVVPILCDWAQTDTEALLLKYKDICPERGGVSATVSTAGGHRRLAVAVTDDAGRIDSDAFAEARLEAASEGLSMLFLTVAEISDTSRGRETVRALLTYAPHTSPKNAGWIKSLEAAGIRVAALSADSSAASARAMKACGLCDRYPVDTSDGTERAIADRIHGGLRAFVGCSDQEIEECIRALQAEGRVVGVLSVDARDIAHLHRADVAITCAPSAYAAAESDFARPTELVGPAVADGLPMSDRAADPGRRRADVVVRRASAVGGGLGGVRTALLAADRTKTALDTASAYLILANALRLWAVILAFSFGLLPIPAPLLLFSGLGVDTLVLFAISRVPMASAPAPRRTMTDGLEHPWYTHRIGLIALAASSALPWVVAFVARLNGAGFDDGVSGYALSGYALLCFAAQQMAIYLAVRPRRDARGQRLTDRSSVFTVLALALIYVGSLAFALGAGLHPLYALLIPPIPAALYMAAQAVITRFFGHRS